MIQPEAEIVKLSAKYAKNTLKDYRPNSLQLRKIVKFIHKFDKFLLTTHIGADPDGLGSEVALYHLLKKLKKKVIILNSEKVPSGYRFIDSDGIVLNVDEHMRQVDNEGLKDFFLLIIDNSEVKRCRRVFELAEKYGLKYATIDHHIVADAPHICADPNYGSTAELIWDLYYHMGIPIPQKVATPLYAGMIADTGNFRFSRTSFRSHLAAGDMIARGVSSEGIYRTIFENAPVDKMTLFQRIMGEAVIDAGLGFVAGFARQSMFENLKLGDSPTEGIVNQLLAAEGIRLSALMTETPEGFLKCSLRSIGAIDVSSVASKFGGGGHKNASGLYIEAPYDEARKKVLKEIKTYLNGL